MSATTTVPTQSQLQSLLKDLRLPGFMNYFDEFAVKGEKEGWTFGQYLFQLAEIETEERRQRRIRRFLGASDLPDDKTIETLQISRLPSKIRRLLPKLCQGDFIGRAENVLIFGIPGVGKTHVLCAVGHELIQNGYRVLFTPGYALVERLLNAKKELTLEKVLRILDRFDVVIIDDIGYVQHNRDEMDVLFTFLSERYERRSVMISSNLVFSQWDQIFKSPLTAAAAIDRLVHHSIILEMAGIPSFRGDHAKQKNKEIDVK
jgi:DNA replication protein DnaC